MNTLRLMRNNSSRFNRMESIHVLGAIVVLLLVSLPAFAQLSLGRVFGVVTDSSGAAVVGATVTVTDVERGVSRTLITDSAGAYSAPSLIPGSYSVRAEAKGFRAIVRQSLTLGVAQNLRVDLALQPGEQTQTVTVTGAPPAIDTTNSVISKTIESQTMTQLPLSGRLYTKVLDFTPGLSGHPGGNSPDYSSNGANTMANSWMIDGVTNTNSFSNSGPMVGAETSNDELTVLPLDAIQEVNVMSNPSAEYGWEQGATVNVGLKSGTNSIHGSAYAYARNAAMDASNPFLVGPPALPKADDDYEQFGASIGGPIKKDKLFYFGNYEGVRYNVGSPGLVQIPSSLANAGGPGNSFPDAIAAMKAASVPLSPLSLNLAGCTAAGVCDPAKGVFTNGTANSQNIPSALANTGHSNNVIVKFDYHLNDRNSLNGEYFFGQATTISNGQGVQPYWTNTNYNRTQMARAVWVYTPSSSLVNEARVGYNRYNLIDGNSDSEGGGGSPNYATEFGFVSGTNPPTHIGGFPVLTINGYTALGAGEGVSDQLVWQSRTSLVDSISYTHGKHLIKFGGEFDRAHYLGFGNPSNQDGAINFNGGIAFNGSTPLEDFLAGTPDNGSVLVGLTQSEIFFDQYAGFVQDDWRATLRWTLNLGVRYEFEPPIVEGNNQLGNFDPNAPSGMVQQKGGNGLYNPEYNDFAPRVGFAWDVTGNGTNVVRGGFSMIYSTLQLDDLLTQEGANLPTMPTGFALYDANGNRVASPGNIASSTVSLSGSQLGWASGKPVFSTSSAALACGNGIGTNPAPCAISGIDPNFKRSPLYTWTLGVEHAFKGNVALHVTYVGNRATGESTFINLNQPTLGDTATRPQRQPYFGTFPWLGQIFQFRSVGLSTYNALQTSLIQRNYHGLTLLADYTYAHSITTGGGGNFPFVQDSTHPLSWYGTDGSTPFHHFDVTTVYNIPNIKSPAQLLKGWEVTSTVNFLGGRAFDASDSRDDFAGTGTGTGLLRQGLNWNIAGSPKAFTNIGLGRTLGVPCYGYAGSRFASFGCSPAVPQACVTAAQSASVNAAMNAAKPGSSSGLASLQKYGCYMEGSSVIVPPAQGTFGDMGKNSLLSVPFTEWDMTLAKNFKIKERLTAQFRAEAYNVTNTRQYSAPSGSLNNPAIFGQALSTPNASNPINGTGGPREMQVGMRLTF